MPEIVSRYAFEAARRLPKVELEHPCGRLHGNSFRVLVRLDGPLDPHLGWVMDYNDLDAVVAPVLAQLDYKYLNEVAGLTNPTTENIAQWIWRKISSGVKGVVTIELHETDRRSCIYRGDCHDER